MTVEEKLKKLRMATYLLEVSQNVALIEAALKELDRIEETKQIKAVKDLLKVFLRNTSAEDLALASAELRKALLTLAEGEVGKD